MAGTRSPEDAINAIVTLLTANLSAKLTAIDTEMDDSITLVDIAAYYKAPLERYDKFPACIVDCFDSVVSDELRSDLVHLHSVNIMVILVGNEAVDSLLPQEILGKRLYRTVRGIEEVLSDFPRLTVSSVDQCDQLIVTAKDYSDTATDGNAFRRDGLIEAQVMCSL